jgi:hypothetical protein
MSQWRYAVMTDKLTTAMQMADRVYSLAKKQNDSALLMGAYAALANTLCYLGDFEPSRRYAMRGLRIWRSGGVKFPVEDIMTPSVLCLIYKALSEWFLGEIRSSQTTRKEAISLAKELNDMNALALALYFASVSAVFERNPAEAERLASELIELSTRYNFAFWLAGAKMLRGWACSVSGNTVEGAGPGALSLLHLSRSGLPDRLSSWPVSATPTSPHPLRPTGFPEGSPMPFFAKHGTPPTRPAGSEVLAASYRQSVQPNT